MAEIVEFKKLESLFVNLIVFLKNNNVKTDFVVETLNNIRKDVEGSSGYYIKVSPFPTLSVTNRVDFDSFKYFYKKHLSIIISFLGTLKEKHPWFDVQKIINSLNVVDLRELWNQGRTK